SLFFFFHAEDGIRDDLVTGVQTCALPISLPGAAGSDSRESEPAAPGSVAFAQQSQGNRGAKTLRVCRTSYPTENRRVVKRGTVIDSAIRIGGVQYYAHFRNIFSRRI